MTGPTATAGDRLPVRPGAGRLFAGQLRYAVTDLWRSPVVLLLGVVLPLVWLLVIGAVAGNDTLDESTGLRVMQFATPGAIAMGVLFTSYPPVATGLADARERGVLKRLRGTPLPPWLYLAGRIGASVVFALGAVLATIGVGVLAFDVQLIGRTAVATVVTLVVGLASFAALGLAVAALSPSTAFAQAASVGTAVALTFASQVFSIGGTWPDWLDRAGDVLPLKPFAEALQTQFDPFSSGAGWDLAGLAVVLAWGMAAVLVAARASGREEGAGRAQPARPPAAAAPPARMPGPSRGPVGSGRVSRLGPVLAQARAADRATWRDGGSVFFALVMPAGLYVLFVSVQGGAALDGVPFAALFAASMVAWGAGVTAFLNLPEAVAAARDRGVLKRLRGTPLRSWQYLAGRILSALWFAVLITALVLVAGVAFFELRLSVGGLVLGLGVVGVGTLTLAACGFVLAALLPDARSVGAVGLGILLPLSFFSEVFLGDPPAWMSTVGALFPLKHFQNALAQAWDPAGTSVGWDHLGVMALWTVAAAAVAVRSFRWEPRPG